MLDWDVAAIADHPQVMAVARALDYHPIHGDDQALRKRYRLEGSGLKLADLPGPTLVRRVD